MIKVSSCEKKCYEEISLSTKSASRMKGKLFFSINLLKSARPLLSNVIANGQIEKNQCVYSKE